MNALGTDEFGAIDGVSLSLSSGVDAVEWIPMATTALSDGVLMVMTLLVVGVIAVLVWHRRGEPPQLFQNTSSTSESQPPAINEVLMDNEEFIQSVMQEHGGRMKQSRIVEETGWSKSKVSMVLSGMAENDEIRKLRVGRENLISLPGHEPDAVGPPSKKSD